MITLSTFDLKKLKNAEHVQLHSNIRYIINDVKPATMGLLDSIFTPYGSAIDAEQDIVNKSYNSAITADIQAADEERGIVFRRIIKRLELCELSNPAGIAYAATELVKKSILAVYRITDVLKLPYQEKTATLTGFYQDCRTILDSDQIEAIGIDGDLDDLQIANQKFARLYQQRISEKSAGTQQLSEVLRLATDQAYQLLTIALNMLANDPTEANAAKVTATRGAVERINTVIAEAKARLSQRMSGNACVVDHVSFSVADNLPVLLNLETEFRIVGKNLQTRKLVMEMVVKPQGALSEIVSISLEEFCTLYGAVALTTRDAASGFEVLTVSGWDFAGSEVTLGSVSA